MDRNKAIDKVKKCLALSSSANANEAAAALRQAQKLMQAHNLTHDDIEGVEYGNAAVECPIQAGKKVPVHLQRFVGLIMLAFQVKAAIETNIRISDASYRIRYFGPTNRIAMAEYAHVVIFRAMENAWRNKLREEPRYKGVRGARLSFMVGFLDAIAEKVQDIGWAEGEERLTDIAQARFYGRELAEVAPREASVYSGLYEKGSLAAESFEINRPLNEEKKVLSGPGE